MNTRIILGLVIMMTVGTAMIGTSLEQSFGITGDWDGDGVVGGKNKIMCTQHGGLT
jgi:hypothetical protein